MKLKVEPLESRHIEDILPRIHNPQSAMAQAMRENPHYAEMMRRAGPAGAFLVDGKTVAMAGVIDFDGTGRGVVWCGYAQDVLVPFVALHKFMMRCLAFYPRRRLEAYVAPGFRAGKRLVKAAGFQFEGVMRSFEADGSDMELWAIIREGA